jgi:16S rRNA (cytosine967-C5)-methyltransferase
VKRGVVARVAAATALQRILDDGGHSNVVVNELREDLGPEDAAQLQRVVLGTIRHLSALDALIAAATRRAITDLDPEVRAVLRSGATELLIDSGEPHGVVDSAVEATRELGKPRATGFVNATLRRLARERGPVSESTFPEWVTERLVAQLGATDAAAALAALDEPTPRGIRVRGGQPPPGSTRVPGIAGAAYLAPGIDVDAGKVDFIDPASTAVANAARVEPGMTVLDVAAAPGGKTAALWDAMDGEGLLIAADAHAGRLGRARRRLERMDAHPEWVVADGRRPPFRKAAFDVVLLDAPCTGLGTLRRRPEIRHRLEPDDPGRLGELQRQLLEVSLGLVKPGGRLVYAVCTLFTEETEAVVAGLDAHPPADVPGRRSVQGVLLAPHLTGTDGMYISVIEV